MKKTDFSFVLYVTRHLLRTLFIKAQPHRIKEAMAEEQRMASRFLNDTDIAKAQRDFELKKAAYDVEVQTKKVPNLGFR